MVLHARLCRGGDLKGESQTAKAVEYTDVVVVRFCNWLRGRVGDECWLSNVGTRDLD